MSIALDRQIKRQRLALLALLGLVLAVWLFAVGYLFWRLRGEALEDGRMRAELHVRNLEEHFTQALRAVDLTAFTLNPGVMRDVQSGRMQAASLFEALRPAPFVRSASLLDEAGRVIESVNPDNLGLNVDLGSFYPAVRPEADIVRIGPPWQGRDLADGHALQENTTPDRSERTFIPVLRRLPSEQGVLWLLVTLNPDYFVNLAGGVLDSPGMQVQWLRYDDVLLIDGDRQAPLGSRGQAGKIVAQLDQHANGEMEQTLQGRTVLTSYRSSSQFPVLIAVHVDPEPMLASWRRDVERWMSVALPMLLALVMAAMLLMQRRAALAREQAARDEQERLAATLFRANRDAVVIADPDGTILSMNPAFEIVTGYSEVNLLQRSLRQLLTDERNPQVFDQALRVLRAEGQWVGERVLRQVDGQVRHLRIRLDRVSDAEAQMRHITCVLSDVTEHKAAEAKLQLAGSVFSHAQEGIAITQPNGEIIDVNESFTRITGYARAEVLGKNPRILSSGHQGREFYQAMWGELLDKGRWVGEIWNRRKSGEVYAELLNISAVRDEGGELMHYVALFSDISQQKAHEERLQRLAHFDALTGLPNRVLLADRLRQAMSLAQRRATRLAVVFLDLDGFKAVNDEHGHDTGDIMLRHLAQRLKLALREGDTLARIGGDEFVAVLVDADRAESLGVLNRLRQAAAESVAVDDLQLQVSASLGVTFYPQAEEVDAEQLLRQADQAMYQAKLAGKNRAHIFDAEQDRDTRGRHETLDEVRAALERDEFMLHYQPKVNMRTGQVLGVEALVRWQHPKRGLLPPAAFLPAVEGHPLALQLGYCVLQAAMDQAQRWKSAGLHLPVSVNADGHLLQQPDFIPRLKALLGQHPQLTGADIELEVLETNALEDVASVADVIAQCKALGVGFALDDFGTGYSSLTYLRQLPARLLKIDQSFVRGMLDNPEDLAILEGVLSLATAFRREAIAEGVETEAHGQLLLRLGCTLGQGYAVARPMPGAQVPGWIAQWELPATWRDLPAARSEDQPMLHALVEHRAWLLHLREYLRGLRGQPPELDPSACRFGLWLRQAHEAANGALPHLQDLATVHQQLHEMAEALLAAGLPKGPVDPTADPIPFDLLALSERMQQGLLMQSVVPDAEVRPPR